MQPSVSQMAAEDAEWAAEARSMEEEEGAAMAAERVVTVCTKGLAVWVGMEAATTELGRTTVWATLVAERLAVAQTSQGTKEAEGQ